LTSSSFGKGVPSDLGEAGLLRSVDDMEVRPFASAELLVRAALQYPTPGARWRSKRAAEDCTFLSSSRIVWRSRVRMGLYTTQEDHTLLLVFSWASRLRNSSSCCSSAVAFAFACSASAVAVDCDWYQRDTLVSMWTVKVTHLSFGSLVCN
jgi:hypothetical protein